MQFSILPRRSYVIDCDMDQAVFFDAVEETFIQRLFSDENENPNSFESDHDSFRLVLQTFNSPIAQIRSYVEIRGKCLQSCNPAKMRLTYKIINGSNEVWGLIMILVSFVMIGGTILRLRETPGFTSSDIGFLVPSVFYIVIYFFQRDDIKKAHAAVMRDLSLNKSAKF